MVALTQYGQIENHQRFSEVNEHSKRLMQCYREMNTLGRVSKIHIEDHRNPGRAWHTRERKWLRAASIAMQPCI